jgi:hypothetical protein
MNEITLMMVIIIIIIITIIIIELSKLSNQKSPWGRVFSEKLILVVPQLVKKFPAMYETRRFITAFTSGPYPEPDQYSPCLANSFLPF